MEIMFSEAAEVLWDQIGPGKNMVLATRNGKGVSARTVSAAASEGTLVFLTFSDSRKYRQMKDRREAAFCIDGIQLTGEVTFRGLPGDEQNRVSAAAIQKAFPEWFALYSVMPGAEVIAFTPETAAVPADEKHIYTIDFVNQRAEKSAIG
ncbi:pyridoxamine 5'-phosphate oxidase family protein [Breznakiella homolactica]|uniref:Pyridoxamine 5'-phosphate oxidase family protein n=1 Tax=Breznakiella homolactica TaxID=2798577 RepID=A0A7T7XPE0_9SPIR|nr:pyridoxamine 5'-phosphate oxidase family protein [Breznakiella homolactica]QQO10046.1 pyridoxamine 5'-phosphate oxidase family protein [Breznakiella homolactica]